MLHCMLQALVSIVDRYTCRIKGQEVYLWLEKGGWFVARKEKYMQEQNTDCDWPVG